MLKKIYRVPLSTNNKIIMPPSFRGLSGIFAPSIKRGWTHFPKGSGIPKKGETYGQLIDEATKWAKTHNRSFKKGGSVKKTGIYQLHKGEKVIPVKKKKKSFSMAKAKKILEEKNPTLHGIPISKGQRGLLGLIAGGKTPRRLSK